MPRAILAGLVGVLAIGGVLGTLLLADAPPEPERQPGREAGVAAAPAARAPCDPPGARLVVADGASRVYRLGRAVYACRRRGPAVRLGRRGGDARYRLAGARVAYVRDRCRTSRACTSAVTSLRLGAPGGARLRERFAATGGATGLELSRRGAVAVMLRGACSDGVACAPPSLYFVDEHGTRLVDSGPGLDEHSLAGDGTTVYWRDSGHVDYGLLSESD